MLIPASRNVFSWSTPDPNDDWLMVGHLLLTDSAPILIDPPVVPGIVEALESLGGVSAIVLTTGDHVRGSEFFSRRFEVPVYAPFQTADDIDPSSFSRLKSMDGMLQYDGNSQLPGRMKAFPAKVGRGKSSPSISEMMILTGAGELLAGDIAMGSLEGSLLTRNEFFYDSPAGGDVAQCLNEIRKIILETGSRTLLSSHGCDITGKLQEKLEERYQ